MTVYIVQRPTRNSSGWEPDLSTAAEYGALEYVFEANEKVYALPGPSLRKAKKILEKFDHENDHILWPNIGDPMAFAAWMLALGQTMIERQIPFVSFLQWNRKRNEDGTRDPRIGFYVPCKFVLINNIPTEA